MANRKHELKPGEVYELLTVVREVESIKPKKHKIRMILCTCSCGIETVVRLDYLIRGHTKSCGCLVVLKAYETKGTHRMSNTKLHAVWNSMKSRCLNESVKGYKNYGGRGIKVHDKWLEFLSFYEWAMANGYQNGLTLERKNVNGNYEPSNCTWIPISEQSKNRRITIHIKYKGEKKTIKEWAEKTGVAYRVLSNRYHRGWTPERIIEQPIRGGKHV